jgi:hypothetical protein
MKRSLNGNLAATAERAATRGAAPVADCTLREHIAAQCLQGSIDWQARTQAASVERGGTEFKGLTHEAAAQWAVSQADALLAALAAVAP